MSCIVKYVLKSYRKCEIPKQLAAAACDQSFTCIVCAVERARQIGKIWTLMILKSGLSGQGCFTGERRHLDVS